MQPGLFRNLRNLKKLILEGMDMRLDENRNINENVFVDLVNLEYLKCESYFIDHFDPIFVFHFKLADLINLKSLNLSRFEIDQKLLDSIKSRNIFAIALDQCNLKENIFIGNMPSLSVFHYYNRDEFDFEIEFGNNMTKLEFLASEYKLNINSIFILSNLKSLYLDYFDVKYYPQLFINLNSLTNLKELSLNLRNVESLSDGVFSKLVYLKELSIHSNKIEELSLDVFSQLENLQKLVLSLSSIQTIKKETFLKLSCLKEIKMFAWSLNFDETLFEGLEQLEELFLSYKIKDSNILKLFNCNNLKILRVYGEIEILDDGIFSHLSCLENLDLSENNINEIRKDAFKGLENLKILNLNYNDMEEFRPGVFAHLKQLEMLDCAENQLKSLVNGVFSPLICLNKLNLSINRIENIENDTFKGLGNLRELDLSGNYIFKIDYSKFLNVFRGLFRLKKFILKFYVIDQIEFDSDKAKVLKEFFGETIDIQLIGDN